MIPLSQTPPLSLALTSGGARRLSADSRVSRLVSSVSVEAVRRRRRRRRDRGRRLRREAEGKQATRVDGAFLKRWTF